MGTNVAHTRDLPVGAAVNFYCKEDTKRPRADEWDSDTGDGVISG